MHENDQESADEGVRERAVVRARRSTMPGVIEPTLLRVRHEGGGWPYVEGTGCRTSQPTGPSFPGFESKEGDTR